MGLKICIHHFQLISRWLLHFILKRIEFKIILAYSMTQKSGRSFRMNRALCSINGQFKALTRSNRQLLMGVLLSTLNLLRIHNQISMITNIK